MLTFLQYNNNNKTLRNIFRKRKTMNCNMDIIYLKLKNENRI